MEKNSFKIWSLALIGAVFFHGALAYYIASPSSIEPYKVGQKGTIIELSFEGASRGGKRQKGNVKKATPAAKKKQAPLQKVTKTPQKTPAPKKIKPTPKKIKQKPKETPKKPLKTTPNSRQKELIKPHIPPTSAVPALSSEQPLPSALSERPPEVVNSLAGAQGQKKTSLKAGRKGEGNAAVSGGNNGVIKKYEDLIQIWVQKHLIYPRRAQKRRLQGIVLIRFTLSAKGKVTQAQILEMAPYSILNKSALKTLQKAQPFPGFFPKMDKADKIFIIPIEYLSP